MRVVAQALFVLHRRPYSETSFLIEALTPEFGRLGLVARGARTGRRGLLALLQPFQPLLVDFVHGPELCRLNAADAAAASYTMSGERSLAGLYLNELLVKLLPRGEAAPTLFARYARALEELSSSPDLAWQLRRFERDALAELGWLIDLRSDIARDPIDATAHYRIVPELGLERDNHGWSGAAIAALADDGSTPSAAQLTQLRGFLRELLLPHMQAPMVAWGMVAALRELGG